MNASVWEISDLRFKNKLLRDKVAAFESGEKYVRMQEEFRKVHAAELRTITSLEAELSRAHAETIRVRELWYGTCQDMETAYKKKLAAKDREIERLEKELQETRKKLDEEREKRRKKTQEYYEAAGQLEEEKEKNAALMAQLHKDYSNSSRSSSMDPNHKTIHNSREKTGRDPGGQPGHIHHGRKRKKPTKTVRIPSPEEYTKDPNFKATGRLIRKQLIKVHVTAEVIEYIATEFRNQTTGQRVHAEFPEGLTDDVTYDDSVKAIAYLVNNGLYASIGRTQTFLEEVTHGAIDLSSGFICNLAKEFSEKTEEEREEIFRKIMANDLMHADFTFGRVNGKTGAAIITATEDSVLYQGREKKGDEGVKGSPLEYYNGTLVSDHEAALIKHGSRHQECIAHVQRYAKGAAQNEPEKTWAGQLEQWAKDSQKYWYDVRDNREAYDQEKAGTHISRLKEILECAKKEYEYEPPSRYNRDGYNLYKRMEKDFEDYVLFLHDPMVPPDNSVAERSARRLKRKFHQVMAFRSQEGFCRFCDGLTVMESVKARNENVYDAVSERFSRARKRST